MNIRDFGYYRVAAVTPEMRVADVDFNTKSISEVIKKNSGEIELFVFPELSLTGYTCQDLFYQRKLLDGVISSLNQIKEISLLSKSTLIVGAPILCDNRLFNCAVLINNGEYKGVVPKTHLANYGEYYESRWFASEIDRISDEIQIGNDKVPFGTDIIFEDVNNKKFQLGVEICEDLWSVIPPSCSLALSGATVIANLSASNEYLGKSQYREDNTSIQSARTISAYIYSSAGVWESVSDTVFSGSSMIYENGKPLAVSAKYSYSSVVTAADIDIDLITGERQKNMTFARTKANKHYRVISIDITCKKKKSLNRSYSKTPFVPGDKLSRRKVCSEISSIQINALKRRLLHINARNVVLGVSGGLDSTLALLVCYQAFKELNYDTKGIKTITMPGFGTTSRTKNNASGIAALLNTDFVEISIDESIKQHFKDIGHDISDANVVYENAQARERTQILMDLANKYNAIVIGTGDLSESALGWCTFNGDHMSMYAVNSGVPKTLVKYLIEWYRDEYFVGELSLLLDDIINTPISPELLPNDSTEINQETERIIGPYELNDFFLYHFIRFGFAPEKIAFLAEQVFKGDFTKAEISNILNNFYRRFFANQFKRNAVPDGPKVGSVSLSPRTDWRMPSEIDTIFKI